MDHIAIMHKNWGLIPMILSGEKSIESRWYKTRRAPWGRIQKGDTVYFKNSGEQVTAKVTVSKVIQKDILNKPSIHKILSKYGEGLGIENTNWFYEKIKDKNYCILIFLKDPKEVKPFEIDKSGFGAMSAWLCVEDIKKIKLRV